MSISIKSAAATLAAFALAAAVSLPSSAALADTKGTGGGAGQRAPGGIAGQKSEPRGQKKCYWLPTVANGTVTGVHPVCN